MDDKLKRDAIALVILAHPKVGFSPTTAARLFGRTKQRWSQRLATCRKNGWVALRGPELTPRGSEIREGVLRPLRELQAAGKAIDMAELLAGPWRGVV
jgi:hypothetical protein